MARRPSPRSWPFCPTPPCGSSGRGSLGHGSTSATRTAGPRAAACATLTAPNAIVCEPCTAGASGRSRRPATIRMECRSTRMRWGRGSGPTGSRACLVETYLRGPLHAARGEDADEAWGTGGIHGSDEPRRSEAVPSVPALARAAVKGAPVAGVGRTPRLGARGRRGGEQRGANRGGVERSCHRRILGLASLRL